MESPEGIMTVREADVYMTVIHNEWLRSWPEDNVDMGKVWEASKAILHALNKARDEVAKARKQRDILYVWLKKHCKREIQIDRLVFVDTDDEMETDSERERQKETIEFLEVFDSLSGEGGGV